MGARGRLVLAALAGVVAFGVWFRVTSRADRAIVVRPGELARLTSEPGMELDPALSPDGHVLAYSAGPPGHTRIRLRELSSGVTSSLTDGTLTFAERWPQWSDDGTEVAFQGVPAPSAAGERRSQVYVIAASGGTPRRLEPGAARGGMSPSWFPHRQEIAFGGEGAIYSAATSAQESLRRLVAGAGAHSPRWSPDGRWLVYVENGAPFSFGTDDLGNVSASRLVLHPAGSSAKISLTDGNALDTNPVWLPDSRTLLFISSRGGGGGGNIYQLRVGPQGSTGDDPQRFKSGLSAHTMSLSPDGTRLLYSSYPPGASIWSVAIPSSGSASMADATQLTFASEQIVRIALSRDGHWLAFDSDREKEAGIWKLPSAGGEALRLTRGTDNDVVNEWSPDGSELVIHVTRGGQRDVMVVSADGARREPVAASPLQEHHAAWGPDGNSIVFDAPPKAGERVQAFISMRAAKGAPWGPARQITHDGSGDPRWSPDGRLIAFCVDNQLRVIAPDGTGERVLFDGRHAPVPVEPSYPIWSRDSRTIYFRIYGPPAPASIWSIGLDGSAARPIITFDDPAHRSLRREFATDGTRLYFIVARDESDIWVMTLNR